MRATGLVCAALALGLGLASAVLASDPKEAEAPPPPTPPLTAPTPEAIESGTKSFAKVAQVLLSPRCRNCHPAGDAPLQTDAGRPHSMNISRRSEESGIACWTCHQERNSEALGIPGGPPGAPHWGLPPKETPMVFEGHTPRSLCEQLKDPERNGERSLHALLEHVSKDPLILWAWQPGGNRSIPPIPHAEFVAHFSTWVDSQGACP